MSAPRELSVYRELGFRLGQIDQLMADDADPVAHLRRQLEAKRMGMSLTPEEQFELFGGFNADDHAADAEESWGASDAYRESARRTARYSKEDWQRVMSDAHSAVLRVIEAMNAGKPAHSIEAMNAAEAHRQQITSASYECSYPIHVGLAGGYVADPRFTATYEKITRHGYSAGGAS